jgi:putative endonuclease
MRAALLERTVAVLDTLAQKRGRDAAPAHLAAGMRGEDAAFFYLMRKGYIVVARRWSAGHVRGDVDLIAWQGDVLCFFEIKTRTTRDLTPAESAVDDHKRTTLRRLARAYLRQLGRETPPPVRFDVISVYLLAGRKPEMVHFEAAFSLHEEFRDRS